MPATPADHRAAAAAHQTAATAQRAAADGEIEQDAAHDATQIACDATTAIRRDDDESIAAEDAGIAAAFALGESEAPWETGEPRDNAAAAAHHDDAAAAHRAAARLA